MQETLRHKEAFEYYLGLGEKRSITQVARHFTVSRPAVSKWSKEFKWQQRLKEREAKIAAKVEEKADKTIAERKARSLQIVEAVEERFVERFDKGEIDPESVKDLETATKLKLLLLGEPTERGEVSVDVDIRRDIAQRLSAITERRRALRAPGEHDGGGA